MACSGFGPEILISFKTWVNYLLAGRNDFFVERIDLTLTFYLFCDARHTLKCLQIHDSVHIDVVVAFAPDIL